MTPSRGERSQLPYELRFLPLMSRCLDYLCFFLCIFIFCTLTCRTAFVLPVLDLWKLPCHMRSHACVRHHR